MFHLSISSKRNFSIMSTMLKYCFQQKKNAYPVCINDTNITGIMNSIYPSIPIQKYFRRTEFKNECPSCSSPTVAAADSPLFWRGKSHSTTPPCSAALSIPKPNKARPDLHLYLRLADPSTSGAGKKEEGHDDQHGYWYYKDKNSGNTSDDFNF
jgi:hypothetical protein